MASPIGFSGGSSEMGGQEQADKRSSEAYQLPAATMVFGSRKISVGGQRRRILRRVSQLSLRSMIQCREPPVKQIPAMSRAYKQ